MDWSSDQVVLKDELYYAYLYGVTAIGGIIYQV